jgi:serine/threonine protein kinase
MTIAAGSRLGPYEVLSSLGTGGMGEVWKARDTRLARTVAIKVLSVRFSVDSEALVRFEREARSASALNHPNIVTVYEVGEAGGVSYISMELVEGATLREILEEGPMPLRKVLPVAAQIADGLAKAHGAGIVHRDLKPENVMVSRDGFVKILDFGLAKQELPEVGSGSLPTLTTLTRAGTVLGPVGYMSPEQASGRSVDFRSDQFSFGAMLGSPRTGFESRPVIPTRESPSIRRTAVPRRGRSQASAPTTSRSVGAAMGDLSTLFAAASCRLRFS